MLELKTKNNAIKALDEKRFFKLVCGASLTDTQIVKNLSFLFTLAGADVIDLAPRADVIMAARNGIVNALSYVDGLKQETGSRKQEFFNIMPHASCLVSPIVMASIQIDKDPHFRKVEVNYDKCDLCGACISVCPTEAFKIEQNCHSHENGNLGRNTSDQSLDSRLRGNDREFIYMEERCFGCNACPPVCHVSALSMKEIKPTPIQTLNEMMQLGVDAIEFHFGKSYEKLKEIWKEESKIANLGLVSFSIGSELLTREEIKKAALLCYKLAGKGIILQCDGKPMSGAFEKNGNNIDNSSINVAKIVQEENLPVYLQLSGGTSERSYTRAISQGVRINGVALGSYARRLLMPYLSSSDILEDKQSFESAIEISRKLVNSVKKH